MRSGACALLTGLWAASLGCGSPPAASTPVAEEFVEVDYPPPPAQIEELDEELAGRPDCSFLDGHYDWQGRRWIWTPGSWVVPPPGCRHAPGLVSWSRGERPRLYYAPPRWYPTRESGTHPNASSSTVATRRAACPPPTPCQSPARRRP